MKTRILILTVIVTLFQSVSFSQSIQVVEKQYNVEEPVAGIIIEGVFTVNYTQGPNTNVTVISSPEDASKISVKTLVAQGITFLKVSATSIKNSAALMANIESPALNKLQLSGTCTFKALNPLESDIFSMGLYGTTSAYAEFIVDTLNITTSGTSTAFISGSTKNVNVDASGVSNVDITALQYNTGKINTSGISIVGINRNANKNQINSSGMSMVNFSDQTVMNSKNGESVTSAVSSNKIVTIYGNDSTSYEDLDRIMNATGNTITQVVNNFRESAKIDKFIKCRRTRFNGHWGGIDIGINGYNTPNFNMDFPQESNYLDLLFPKSISFYLNLIEYNISFSKNQKWGMLSGLGFEWHNYRFSPDTWVTGDSSVLQGHRIEGAVMSKSKLTLCYLTIPLIFEFQTNSRKSFKNSFHVGAGVVGGVRIGSHSKIKFDQKWNTFTLVDPITGEQTSGMAMIANKKILKQRNDFHLAPFKLDATVRIGWGRINLFATYSIFDMFRGNRGPELYPWSAGITLIGW